MAGALLAHWLAHQQNSQGLVRGCETLLGALSLTLSTFLHTVQLRILHTRIMFDAHIASLHSH